MHFKKLENLKYEHATGQTKISSVFFDSLDDWIFSLNRQQSDWINPVQFSEIYGLPFGEVVKIFNQLTARKMFEIFFTVNSITGEMILKVNNKQDLKELEGKTLFSQDENRYVRFNKNDYEVSGWYRLIDLASSESKKEVQKTDDFFGGNFSNKNPSSIVSKVFEEMLK